MLLGESGERARRAVDGGVSYGGNSDHDHDAEN
jgi:hypothetical protein